MRGLLLSSGSTSSPLSLASMSHPSTRGAASACACACVMAALTASKEGGRVVMLPEQSTVGLAREADARSRSSVSVPCACCRAHNAWQVRGQHSGHVATAQTRLTLASLMWCTCTHLCLGCLPCNVDGRLHVRPLDAALHVSLPQHQRGGNGHRMRHVTLQQPLEVHAVAFERQLHGGWVKLCRGVGQHGPAGEEGAASSGLGLCGMEGEDARGGVKGEDRVGKRKRNPARCEYGWYG